MLAALYTENPMSDKRRHLFFVWALSNSIICLVISLISLAVWELTYIQKPDSSWSPMNDWAGMIGLMPIGWLLALFTPAGWLSLIGLGFAVYKSHLKYLAISWLGSILFGVLWPLSFVILMSA